MNRISCKNIKLNSRISIYRRGLKSQSITGSSTSIGFELIATVYGHFKTFNSFTKGTKEFDQVGQSSSVTHQIYTRYTTLVDINTEMWLKYNDDYYKIESVNNIDENDRFLLLNVIKQGDSDIEANFG
jgi:head-tail adaptor